MVTVPSLVQLVLNASVQYFVRQHLHRSFDHLAQLGRRPFLRPVRRDLALVRSTTKLATVKHEKQSTAQANAKSVLYREQHTKHNHPTKKTHLKSDMSGLTSVDARIV